MKVTFGILGKHRISAAVGEKKLLLTLGREAAVSQFMRHREAIGILGVVMCAGALGSPSVSQGKDLAKIRATREGSGFVTESGKAFVPFGVTYYRPGTGWAPQVWKQFDAQATRRDFSRMKELGVNCVRVFLSFGSFYHAPGVLDTNGLAKFDQFLSSAEEAGIYVHPTGPDLWEGPPEWTLGGIEDEKTLLALEQFWKLFAARYRGRNVIFAYDLRNEPAVGWDGLERQWNSWLADKYHSIENLNIAWGEQRADAVFGSVPVPPRKDAPGDRKLLDFQNFREHLANEWTRRQAAVIRAADSRALVTVGLVQWSVPSLLPGDLSTYSGFRPAQQARYLDFLEVHFYPLLNGGYKYQDDESETRNLAYLESVLLGTGQPGKPIVLAEFGWYGGGKPRFNNGLFPSATEVQQAEYNRKVVETSAGLACGWLNWGFYDQPEATDCSELTGLITAGGKVKTWGQTFKELATNLQATSRRSKPSAARPTLNWDACLSSIKSQQDFLKQYITAFSQSTSH